MSIVNTDIEYTPNIGSTSYFGERTTSRGTKVNTYLAAQALSQMHSGKANAIFDYYNDDRIVTGRNLPEYFKEDCQVDNNNFQLAYTIGENKRVSFNYSLKKSVLSATQDYERPIVFLVTSSAPHAMIYIIDGPRLYTVGFGYNDVTGRSKLSKTLNRIGQHGLAHSIETVNGALYTADYLMPGFQHEAKIAWVGFLDMNMVNSIEEDLNTVTTIIYSGNINAGGGYNVSNECILMLPRQYCEAAGFINKGTTNCILWAQSKLHINIDCGFLGSPKDCQSITEDEFEDIKNNLNSGPQLEEIITNIQRRLTAGNFCTRISRRLGLCGGGVSKKRKNNKPKNNNKSNNNKSKNNKSKNNKSKNNKSKNNKSKNNKPKNNKSKR